MSRIGGTAPLRVAVIAHHDDALIAAAVEERLRSEGVLAERGLPDAGTTVTVVILSAAFLTQGLPMEDGFSNHPVVTVAHGPIHASRLPAELADLNWILWDPSPSRALAAIVAACRTDVKSFKAMEVLIARADGWAASDKDQRELIDSHRRLVAMKECLISSGLTPVPEHVVEYLATSGLAVRGRRLRLIGRFILWTILGAAVLISSFSLVGQVGYVKQRQELELLFAYDMSTFSNDATGIKFVALGELIRDNGDEPYQEITDALVAQLSMPWRVNQMATVDGKFVNDIVATSGENLLAGDGGGRVWRGTARELVEPRQVSRDPIYHLAATPDEGVLVVADLTTITLDRHGDRDTLKITGEIDDLILAPDGGLLAVSTSEGTVLVNTSGPPQIITTVPSLITVNVINSRLVALQHSPGVVTAIDLVSGAELASYPIEVEPDGIGVVGDHGVAMQGSDGRIWASQRLGDVLSPITANLSRVELMSIDAQGTLFYTPLGSPTQLFDLSRGVRLGSVCGDGSATWIVLAADDSWIACNHGSHTNFWGLEELRPSRWASGELSDGPPIDPRGPAEVSESGTVRLTSETRDAREWTVTGPQPGAARPGRTLPSHVALSGRVTAVTSVDQNTFALGTANGEALVAEADADDVLRKAAIWQSPDGSAVTEITVSGSVVHVTTTSATWSFDRCADCSRSFDAAKKHVLARKFPCYDASLTEIIPTRQVEELDLAVCTP